MTGEANQPGFRRVRSGMRRIAVLVGRRRMEAPAYGNEYTAEYEDNLNIEDERASTRFIEYLNRER